MCVWALQHLFDIISRISASKGAFKDMSVDINNLHTPIQTVRLYRYHSMHWYSTIQGLWDNLVLLRKKAVLHRTWMASIVKAKLGGMLNFWNVDASDSPSFVFFLNPPHHKYYTVYAEKTDVLCDKHPKQRKTKPKTEKKMIKSNNPTSSRYAVDLWSMTRFAF